MEYKNISNLSEFQSVLLKNFATLVYFSHNKSDVCKVLKPKTMELVTNEFAKIKLFYVDIYKNPEIAAQNGIFIAPTILLFFDGKENLRISRDIGIDELKKKISRPYKLVYK